MTVLRIECESCDRIWTVAGTFSLYERQAVESRPCPHCGAYTLSCPDPSEQAHPSHNRLSARLWRPRRAAVKAA